MSCDVFSGKPGAPNVSGEYRDWLSLNSAKHQAGAAGASSLRRAAPVIREKYLAPSRGRFRFRAMKDDYEKMKTHTSQTKATHIAALTLLMRATSKARKAALLLFSVAVLLAGGDGGARAIRARRFRSERQQHRSSRRRPTGRQDSHRRFLYRRPG